MSALSPVVISAAVGAVTYAYHQAAKMELLGDKTRFFSSPAIAASAVSLTTLFAHAMWKKPHASLAGGISFAAIFHLGSTHAERRIRSRGWGP